MIHKRMTEAAFDAEELTVQTVDVAIAGDNTHQVATAGAQRHLAAVRAEGASRNRLGQFPRTRLVPIGAVEQGPRRTDFDAVATLRTVQPATVSADDGIRTAPPGLDGVFTHPLVAHSSAALAKDAALRIVGNHWRKVSFRLSILAFRKALFETAPIKCHLLQFALAAPITDRTIERMIRQQELHHSTLGFFDLLAL